MDTGARDRGLVEGADDFLGRFGECDLAIDEQVTIDCMCQDDVQVARFFTTPSVTLIGEPSEALVEKVPVSIFYNNPTWRNRERNANFFPASGGGDSAC